MTDSIEIYSNSPLDCNSSCAPAWSDLSALVFSYCYDSVWRQKQCVSNVMAQVELAGRLQLNYTFSLWFLNCAAIETRTQMMIWSVRIQHLVGLYIYADLMLMHLQYPQLYRVRQKHFFLLSYRLGYTKIGSIHFNSWFTILLWEHFLLTFYLSYLNIIYL